MAKNKTRYAVLGMLTWGPMSGYDIREAMKTSTNFFWAESDGQLYPALKALVKEGKISFQEESSPGGRKRKIYQITRVGQCELNDWLCQALDTNTVRNELLLKLFFGANVPLALSIERVKKHRDDVESRLAQYKKIKANLKKDHSDSSNLDFWVLTLDFGRLHALASLEWCDQALKVLKNKGEK